MTAHLRVAAAEEREKKRTLTEPAEVSSLKEDIRKLRAELEKYGGGLGASDAPGE